MIAICGIIILNDNGIKDILTTFIKYHKEFAHSQTEIQTFLFPVYYPVGTLFRTNIHTNSYYT